MRSSTQPEIFDRYPWCKLLSEAHGDLFPEVSAVNRTMSPLGSISGKCLEFLFMSFRHFPSLVHSSAASCRKSRQREAFPPVLQNPSLAGFSLRGKPATLQRSTKVRGGSLWKQGEEGSSQVGYVLWACFDSFKIVMNSHVF